MELRDLVKIFEESKFDTWTCPLMRCFCDHNCYGYTSKGFSLLLKMPTGNFWGQRFEKSEDIMKWGKSLKKKITVISYMIYPPYCRLLDAVTNLQYGIEVLKCQNK